MPLEVVSSSSSASTISLSPSGFRSMQNLLARSFAGFLGFLALSPGECRRHPTESGAAGSRCFRHSDGPSAKCVEGKERARAQSRHEGVGKRVARGVGECAAERRARRVSQAPGGVHEAEGEALRQTEALRGISEERNRGRPERAERDRSGDDERHEHGGTVGKRETGRRKRCAAEGEPERKGTAPPGG